MHPVRQIPHDVTQTLLSAGHLTNPHSFNHPFSINNLMSENKLDMKMYEPMQGGYGAYSQLSPLALPKESSPPMSVADANYYKTYTPHSTSNFERIQKYFHNPETY